MKVKAKVTMEKLWKKWVMVSWILKLMITEMYILNILTTENLDDGNFIHSICIADTIPMMQSGKKRMLAVTTHGIPWKDCLPNDYDSKFKSKSDLKCHTECHEALDSGKTFPCQHCNYIGKTPKRLADHKQVHYEHRCNYAGCNAVINHHQKLLNHKKGRITFNVYCYNTTVSGFIIWYYIM